MSRISNLLSRRQARYGTNALILSLAFLGIVVLINIVIYNVTQDSGLKWDLTENQRNTLTEESLDVLAKLPEPVKVQAFFSSQVSSEQARTMLEKYQDASQGKFTFEFIDPLVDTVAAEQAKISQDGSLVLHMGDSQQIVYPPSEQELTNGLMRLLNPQESVIYFLTGHGEPDLEGSDQQDYSLAKLGLESKNFTVRTLSLLTSPEVPADAQAVVLAGPVQPLAQVEIERLEAYVQGGGSLAMLINPELQMQLGEQPDLLVDYIETAWGIQLRNDVVIDDSSGQSRTFAIGVEYGNSPITSDLQGVYTIFPVARSLQLLEPGEGISLENLVFTGSGAWAESQPDGMLENPPVIEFDEAEDSAGPLTLAVVAENFNTGSRLVVFGDLDFGANGNIVANGNADLLLNSLVWTAGEQELISISPRQSTSRVLNIPPQRTAMNLIFLATVVIIPGLALLAGIMTFFERRKRG